ncbi:MAG: energy transducer TonB, partial [Alphaproteobacteria bacterium]|nr:energy transducer TonB [Alphaproteobacteria bacterium]
WARRQGIEGIVVLRVAVQPDGGAAGVEVARSCGHPRLDGIAAEAVRNWRFAPARRGAEAVASVVEVPIRFSLTDRERKS